MHVKIEYHDDSSITAEEIVRQATHTYGKLAQVSIMPDSLKPHDMIYFALQQIMTHQQLSMLYDSKEAYQVNIKKLRAETLYKIEEILDQVIIDNEEKIC